MDKGDLLLIINCLLGLVAFFGAMVGRNLTEAIKELKIADKELSLRLENYVKRDDLGELKAQVTAIFRKLDEIKDGLGNKMSREECDRYHRGQQ